MERIKLSDRTARRLLALKPCVVFVEKASSSFKTEPGLRQGPSVFAPAEGILIPLKDITAIEAEDRFGSRSRMEVDWE